MLPSRTLAFLLSANRFLSCITSAIAEPRPAGPPAAPEAQGHDLADHGEDSYIA